MLEPVETEEAHTRNPNSGCVPLFSLKSMNILTFERNIRILKESTDTAEFWSVSIDGESITQDAKPFDASHEKIILRECDYCYFCGMPEVSVRRTDDRHVIWFVDLDDDHSPTIGRDRVFEFELETYQTKLGGATDELPHLSLHEFERIIAAFDFPSAEDALYTIPDLPNDSLGKRTLSRIGDALADDRIEMRLELPRNIKKLNIGLDIEKIPESQIAIGQLGSETVFRFEQLPSLPVWRGIRGDPQPFQGFHADSVIAE